MAVFSDGSYNTPAGVMFSFPVRCNDRQWEIVQVCHLCYKCSILSVDISQHIVSFQGLNLDDFARGKLELTSKELVEERDEALAVCQD